MKTGTAATLRKCQILFMSPHFQEEKTPWPASAVSPSSEMGPHDQAVKTEAPCLCFEVFLTCLLQFSKYTCMWYRVILVPFLLQLKYMLFNRGMCIYIK